MHNMVEQTAVGSQPLSKAQRIFPEPRQRPDTAVKAKLGRQAGAKIVEELPRPFAAPSQAGEWKVLITTTDSIQNNSIWRLSTEQPGSRARLWPQDVSRLRVCDDLQQQSILLKYTARQLPTRRQFGWERRVRPSPPVPMCTTVCPAPEAHLQALDVSF